MFAHRAGRREVERRAAGPAEDVRDPDAGLDQLLEPLRGRGGAEGRVLAQLERQRCQRLHLSAGRPGHRADGRHLALEAGGGRDGAGEAAGQRGDAGHHARAERGLEDAAGPRPALAQPVERGAGGVRGRRQQILPDDLERHARQVGHRNYPSPAGVTLTRRGTP
jgi:hypothetical protein